MIYNSHDKFPYNISNICMKPEKEASGKQNWIFLEGLTQVLIFQQQNNIIHLVQMINCGIKPGKHRVLIKLKMKHPTMR